MLSPYFLYTLLEDDAITGQQNKNSGSQEKAPFTDRTLVQLLLAHPRLLQFL